MTRWELERAVLRSSLAPSSRLIVMTLAALADWPGGSVPARYTPSLSTLAEMTGLSRRAVVMHLDALESAGWVVRLRPVPERARSQKDRTRYKLDIPASAAVAPASASAALDIPAPKPPASASVAPELVHQLHPSQTLARPRAAAAHPPASASARPAASPEQIIIDATGASPAEAAAVARRVATERQPRSLIGLLRRMAADGDLGQLLTEQRAAVTRARTAEAIATARRGPDCDHGVAGGRALHPASREPLCPQCRAVARVLALPVRPASTPSEPLRATKTGRPIPEVPPDPMRAAAAI